MNPDRFAELYMRIRGAPDPELERGLAMIRAHERYLWRTGIALGMLIGTVATCALAGLAVLVNR